MKAVVLHSGGLDSTLCLLMAQEAAREVISLGFDYGQRHRIELEYASAQCHRFDIQRRVLRIEWTKSARQIPTGRVPEEIRAGVSPAFLPGRNAVFLCLGCAEAAGLGAEEVWTGVNSIDFSGYPDCKPEFVDAFRAMIAVAIPEAPRVVAPLMEMTKPQIAAEAHRLGLAASDTWSCYQPSLSAEGLTPCGACDACVLHEHAWNRVNIKRSSG